MTRYRYGGDAAAWIVELVTDPDVYSGANVVALPSSDVDVPLYSGQDVTTLVTDLQDSTFSPITGITVPSGSPYLPFFYGPDDLTTLYFQDSESAWHALLPSDLGDRTAAAEHDIGDLQTDVATLQAGGGGGGGGGMNYIRQQTAGTLGYPARPDLTTDTTWQGVDDPPIGVVSGQQGMLNGDHFERTPQLLI